MPEEKHKQHYHYLTLQNNRVPCFTAAFVFLELLITLLRRREWQHINSSTNQDTMCATISGEKKLFPESVATSS